jgi:hypothetical protein
MLYFTGAENSTLGMLCLPYGLKQLWIRPFLPDGPKNDGFLISDGSILILVISLADNFKFFWQILYAACVSCSQRSLHWILLLANNF